MSAVIYVRNNETQQTMETKLLETALTGQRCKALLVSRSREK